MTKYTFNQIYIKTIMCLLIVFSISSCKKYLDLQPDKKQVIPTSISDCQALLDDYGTMNSGYPCDGEGASGNLYLLGTTWQALSNKEDRDNYTWDLQGKHLLTQWINSYKVIYNANLVMETLSNLPQKESEANSRNNLRGSALFFRAYAFHQIATLFAAPYNGQTADQSPGIPLRLSSDIAVKSTRGTVRQTYDRIISDLQEAVGLLPLTSILPTRPTKAAAYGALARVYLSMEDYPNAGKMAGECLKLSSTLLDYNALNINGSAPFKQFNAEVIFHSLASTSGLLSTTACKVDTVLYQSYDDNDLRKSGYFRPNSDGSFVFKGNYNGAFSGIHFNGIATDEIYLIRAECYARAGNTALAMIDLNTLMQKRWDNTVAYPTISATDANDALAKVLTERRKELIFRNIRWSDLRRLNRDPRFAVTLKRVLTINGVQSTFTLPPNDLRYTLLIPDDVINNSGLTQNTRISGI